MGQNSTEQTEVGARGVVKPSLFKAKASESGAIISGMTQRLKETGSEWVPPDLAKSSKKQR